MPSSWSKILEGRPSSSRKLTWLAVLLRGPTSGIFNTRNAAHDHPRNLGANENGSCVGQSANFAHGHPLRWGAVPIPFWRINSSQAAIPVGDRNRRLEITRRFNAMMNLASKSK